MKLIVVRHGETEENKNDIMQGQIHGKLSKKGKAQSKKVAKRLSKEKIDIIYSSDLGRAKETCKEIVKYHPKTPVKYVKELREQAYGIFEGRPHKHLDEYMERKKIRRFKDIKAKGMEPLKKKDKRVMRFFRQMIKKHPDKTILWVTHGGIVVPILMHVLGLKERQFRAAAPHNTAVSVIEVDKKGKYKVHRVNCVAHL